MLSLHTKKWTVNNTVIINAKMRPYQQATMVKLPMIPWTMYRDADDEPQPVSQKLPPSALMLLSTQDLPPGADRTDFVISNNIKFFNNVTRIFPIEVRIPNWFVPNVNPRNNQLSFWSAVVNQAFTVTIPEGLYDNSAALAQAINTALNSVQVASGLSFAGTEDPLQPHRWIYDVEAPKAFHFLPSTATEKGKPLYGHIDLDPTDLQAHAIGPFGFNYTYYIDITSETLTKYAKLRSITSASKNILFRAFIAFEATWGPIAAFLGPQESPCITFVPEQNVTSIDMQLFDSNGDPLYLPDSLKDNFAMFITFKVEM